MGILGNPVILGNNETDFSEVGNLQLWKKYSGSINTASASSVQLATYTGKTWYYANSVVRQGDSVLLTSPSSITINSSSTAATLKGTYFSSAASGTSIYYADANAEIPSGLSIVTIQAGRVSVIKSFLEYVGSMDSEEYPSEGWDLSGEYYYIKIKSVGESSDFCSNLANNYVMRMKVGSYVGDGRRNTTSSLKINNCTKLEFPDFDPYIIELYTSPSTVEDIKVIKYPLTSLEIPGQTTSCSFVWDRANHRVYWGCTSSSGTAAKQANASNTTYYYRAYGI